MHYAVVKCERIQLEWLYYKGEKSDFWAKHAYRKLEKLLNDNKYRTYTWEDLNKTEKQWNKDFRETSIYQKYIQNGQCILWEGEVNQERLRIEDNLYIPSIENYLKIDKVEVTPDGKIVYYVAHAKKFYDTAEKSRLKTIEEWMSKDYSDIKNFEEMKKYKDSKSASRLEYEKYLSYKKSLLKTNSGVDITNLDTSNVQVKHYERKEDIKQDAEDLKWQNIVLISLISSLALIVLMILVSTMN